MSAAEDPEAIAPTVAAGERLARAIDRERERMTRTAVTGRRLADSGSRSRVDLLTPAELAIQSAIIAVEAVGAHPLLTDAVVLLARAQNRVADFVEGYNGATST